MRKLQDRIIQKPHIFYFILANCLELDFVKKHHTLELNFATSLVDSILKEMWKYLYCEAGYINIVPLLWGWGVCTYLYYVVGEFLLTCTMWLGSLYLPVLCGWGVCTYLYYVVGKFVLTCTMWLGSLYLPVLCGWGVCTYLYYVVGEFVLTCTMWLGSLYLPVLCGWGVCTYLYCVVEMSTYLYFGVGESALTCTMGLWNLPTCIIALGSTYLYY